MKPRDGVRKLLVSTFSSTDNLSRNIAEELKRVFCTVLWVVFFSSSGAQRRRSPSGCDSVLEFSSEVSSLSEGNWNIHSRSLSPWRWTFSTVENRIPSTLWEAECSSSFCSGPNHLHLNSVPIYQSVLVLTRRGGRRCYTASYQSLVVGCTCIWVKSSQA